MKPWMKMRGWCLVGLLASAPSMASVGTAGTDCTVADYQAANNCLSGTFGTISGMFGSCDLACNDTGTGQPPGSASSAIWCGAGQGAAGTIGAIGTVIQQQGNQIVSCVTGGGIPNCVPIAVVVGGTICAIATAGACVPVMAAGGAALALGNCGYQCLGSNDQTACQQACAGSIITTVGGAVATGIAYAPQLCLPVGQVQWLTPRPVPAVPVPTPEPVPVLPPIAGGSGGLTAAEQAALQQGIQQVFPNNPSAVGSALGELLNAPYLAEYLASQYPGLSFYEALWQHMINTPCSRGWCPLPDPFPPAPGVPPMPPPFTAGPTPPPTPAP